MTERLKLSHGARTELRGLLLTGARQFRHPGRSETPYPELLGWIAAAACELWDAFKKLKPQVGKLGVLPDPSLVLALWVAMIAVLIGYIMTVIQLAPVLFR